MQPFQLHAVLKYRGQLEDSSRQKLFAAREKRASIQALLNRHQQELETVYTSQREAKEKGTTIAELILLENRVSIVQEYVNETKKSLDKADREVENARKELLLASRNKKIIEKIKDHQDLAYQQFLKKKELAMLDELAVLYYKK
ncbi:MAG: flagellar export protein FliJ [Desulfobulbus propionicus]|nr:MAG: flagellar export protein FliJ [Desulfobulbus propionicus]